MVLITVISLFFSFAILASAITVSTPIERKIVDEALDQGVDPNLALKIVKCESGFQQGVKNKSIGSTASGLFQFVRATFESTRIAMRLPLGVDVFDGMMNIKMGVWLLKTAGVTPWLASEHCWKNHIGFSNNI